MKTQQFRKDDKTEKTTKKTCNCINKRHQMKTTRPFIVQGASNQKRQQHISEETTSTEATTFVKNDINHPKKILF